MSKQEVVDSIIGKDFPCSSFPTLSFLVHGLALNVTSNSLFVLNSIDSLLSYFRAPEDVQSPEIHFYLMEYPLSKCRLLPLIRREGRPLFDSRTEDELGISRDLRIRLRYLSWGEFFMADFGSKGVLILHLFEGLGIGFFPNPGSLPPEILSNFIFITGLSEMIRPKGLYLIHAAALAKEEKGVLIPGFTGSGKTTLSLALLRRGFKFLSDDRPFLRREKGGIKILAFPESLDVTEKTISFFPELQTLPADAFKTGLKKKKFSVESIYPNSILNTCAPRVLLFPNIVDRENSRLESISKVEAAVKLLPHCLLVFDQEIAKKHFYLLCQLVEKIDCFRLDLGRNLLAVHGMIEEIL